MDAFKVELNASIHGYSHDCIITYNDVIAAVNKLKYNKGDGNKGLSSDHVTKACSDLSVRIARLTTGMLVHYFVPVDPVISTVIPILKGKNTNVTVWAYYRGIGHSSVNGKIIDLILIDCLSHRIYNPVSKKKRSTTLCSILK